MVLEPRYFSESANWIWRASFTELGKQIAVSVPNAKAFFLNSCVGTGDACGNPHNSRSATLQSSERVLLLPDFTLVTLVTFPNLL